MSDTQEPKEEIPAAAAPAEEIAGTDIGTPDEEVLEFNEEAESIEEEEKRLDRPLTRREKNIINGRKGGRPRGSMTRTAKERKDALEAYKNRVAGNADMILDAQLTAARGLSFLYRIDTITVGKRKEKKPAELVDDPMEIKSYLDGEYDGDEDTYYFITTKAPDMRAVDSMMDRTYGRSAQSIDLKDEEGNSILFMMAQAALKAGITLPTSPATDPAGNCDECHFEEGHALTCSKHEDTPPPIPSSPEKAADPAPAASMMDAATEALKAHDSTVSEKNEATESLISPAKDAVDTNAHDKPAA